MSDPRAALESLIVRNGEDYASLSRLIGRNAAYIQQFIRRGTPRKLAEDDRRTLARYFKVDEAVLGGPCPPAVIDHATPASGKGLRKTAGLVRIARLSVGASAGPGSFDADERDVGEFGFDPAYIRTLSSDPSMLSAIKVSGDSMMPTLGDGDDIIVNRADAMAGVRDGIYVLRLDDALNVKRIARNPGSGFLTIRSDNAAYPSFDDCDPRRIQIIGRVVWVGRRMA